MKETTRAQEIYKLSSDKWFEGYYNPRTQLKTNTSYMFNFGGRNIGKTYGWLLLLYASWQKGGLRSVYMRRHAENVKASKCGKIFDKIFKNNPKLNIKKYDGIQYRTGSWCGYWLVDGKKEYDTAFCYSFALASAVETNKGVLDIENLGMIYFDEALTSDNYLQDEWNRFQNAVSTCVRENAQAFVVLSANTVSWNAPYFREFGIYNPKEIKQGTIKIVNGLEETTISAEYCADAVGNEKKNKVDKRFFSFANSTADMIKNGAWEVRPCQHWQDYHRKDSKGRYYERKVELKQIYLKYEFEYVAIEIIMHEYMGIVANVRPAYNVNELDDSQILRLYTDDFISKPYEVNRPRTSDKLDSLIWGLYRNNKFFYADNVCGECVRRWVNYSKQL